MAAIFSPVDVNFLAGPRTILIGRPMGVGVGPGVGPGGVVGWVGGGGLGEKKAPFPPPEKKKQFFGKWRRRRSILFEARFINKAIEKVAFAPVAFVLFSLPKVLKEFYFCFVSFLGSALFGFGSVGSP